MMPAIGPPHRGIAATKYKDRHQALAMMPVPSVCTENSIRVDHVSESPNVGDDDRAILPLPGPVRLTAQVEEPT